MKLDPKHNNSPSTTHPPFHTLLATEFELTMQHSNTMVRCPGLYAVAVMPKYASSVAQLPELSAEVVVRGGLRIKEAVEYMHGCGYAHMDIKVR